MMSKKNRTRQQMEEEMRQLRKVFMTVRLMKADEVQGGKKGSAPCYAQWRRSRPCENCVARQALEKNTRKTEPVPLRWKRPGICVTRKNLTMLWRF